MQQQAIYSRKWYVMAAVSMGIFLATIDGSIVNVALPTLIRELNTEFATVEWVVLAYMLTLATLLLGVGRLGDMIGKKPIYVTGFVVFTAGSVLCGLAPSVYWLIGFRVVQAIGGAMVFALGMAIVTEAFPPQERGKALGITGTVVSVGIVVGPTLGGVIIAFVSWHWIFLVNLPVGIIGTWMAARFVPNTKPQGQQKFDFAGAIVLFLSLLSFLLALTWGQEAGFTSPPILLLFAGWAVFLILFVVIEQRLAQPMIELTLFKNSLFSMGLITGFISFIATAGTVVLLPFYLENVLGYDTQQVGLMLAVIPVMLGLTSPISGMLSDKFGTRLITVVGLMVMVLGYTAMSTLSAGTGVLGYVLRLIPVGIGLGAFQSPNNSAIMGSVPRQRLGVASGMLSLTRTLGQTTGIAVLSALWASRVMAYAGQTLAQDVTTAPIPAQVAGLQQVFWAVVVAVSVALGLGVWALVQERRTRPAAPVAAPEFVAGPE